MEPIWRPERAVDVRLARALVARVAPELGEAGFELYGEGFDNVAYLVDGAWVFRFPQREMGGALMEVEARVLPAIAPRLPLPIPIPRWVGSACDLHPWPYAGYRVLAGTTVDRASLSDAARGALAPALGEFLAALHAVPTADLDLPGDRIGRMDVPRRLAQTRERLAHAGSRGWVEPARYAAILDAVDPEMRVRDDVLCHGDLYDRHLLVDDDLRLGGVIDWGDVHLGDPGVDLAVAHRVLPPSSHAAFRRAYGPIDDTRWRAARARALGHALATLFYARDVSDGPLEAGCLRSLEYLAVS